MAKNARFHSLATSAKGLWFVSFPKPGDKEVMVRLLRASDNVTVDVARIDFLPTPVGMAVSPDEKSLLVTRPDVSGSDCSSSVISAEVGVRLDTLCQRSARTREPTTA